MKNPVVKAILIVVGVFAILFIGMMAFVIITFDYNPSAAQEDWNANYVKYISKVEANQDSTTISIALDSLGALLSRVPKDSLNDYEWSNYNQVDSIISVRDSFEIHLSDVRKEKLLDNAMVNLFSSWDGSCRPLEKAIKSAMNDPDSYEHVETKFWHVQGEESFIVKTTFRGKNAFGGTVTQLASANVEFNGTLTDLEIQ